MVLLAQILFLPNLSDILLIDENSNSRDTIKSEHILYQIRLFSEELTQIMRKESLPKTRLAPW